MRLLLLLVIIGVVVWQYPQTVTIVADIAGIDGGDACGATEQYLEHVSGDQLSDADQYKFPGDGFPGWVDRLGGDVSIDCTCASDISDRSIEQIRAIPNAVTNVTDLRLVTYTINGAYDGSQSTLKGSALAFRPVSSGWFITQERLYEIDGERQGLVNLAEFSTECTA